MGNPALLIADIKKTIIESPYTIPTLAVVGACGFALYLFLRNRAQQREYVLSVLRSNGLANELTILKKDGVKNPNKASVDWRDHIALICELYKDPRIIDFRYDNHSIVFERANFPKRTALSKNPLPTESGVDHKGKRFCPKPNSFQVRVGSRGGKTVLAFNIIRSSYLARNRVRPKILIADRHESYEMLRDVPGIEIFNLRDIPGKRAFLNALTDVQNYQRSVNLGMYSTLAEAHQSGAIIDRHGFDIIVDEFLEAVTSSVSKEETMLNQQLLSALQNLVTGGAKYSQRAILMYQAQAQKDSPLSPNIFLSEVVNYMPPELAKARGGGLPVSHPMLQQPGVFFYSSRIEPSTFFQTAMITKSELLAILKENQ